MHTEGNAESETAYTGEYTISGTTTENTITVTGGDHTIKLNGVNIDVSGIPRWFHGFLHQGDWLRVRPARSSWSTTVRRSSPRRLLLRRSP
ncbi:MAG: hypothetical protein ACLRSD_13745 [Oscillibacter sp.]